MDLRALIAKMDKIESKQILNEAITMKDIQAAVGQEKDEQKRATILNDLAWKENLPGLYDPISGYFIRKQSPNPETNQVSIAATAREADTQALAKLGLVPGTAKTSALGGLVGTGKFGLDKDSQAANDKASADVKQQSANVMGKQSSDAFIAPKLKRLNDLVAKISGSSMESISFNGEIARKLIESFNYELYEKVTLGTGPAVTNPATGVTAGKYQSEIAEIKSLMAELADIDDPAVIQALNAAQKAVDKLAAPSSPQAQKVDPNQADRDDAEMGAAMRANAASGGDKKSAGPSGTQVQTDDNGNHLITTPDGKTVVVGPDGKPLPNGGKEAPGKPGGKPTDDRKQSAQSGARAGRIGPANPGTRAIQHYLNTKYGKSLQVDGKDGPETYAAITSLGGKVDVEEYTNLAGLGFAYNVIPGQGMSVGSQEFNERMIKLGYNPKTGAPLTQQGTGSTGQSSPGGQAASPKPSTGIQPGQNARDDLLARKGGQAASPTAGGGDVQAELNKIMPNAQGGEEAWYKGTRYQYLRTKGLRNPGEWKPNMKAGDNGWNWNQWAATSGYTGPQSDVKAAWNSASRSRTSTPQAASPTRESINQREDDAILAMIRAVR